MSEALEKRIGRAWAVPNQYHGFPEPLLITLESEYGPPGWKYTRALCPVKGCKYDGLPHGFNQHYARMHDPSQWRQKAKRVIKTVRSSYDR
jgi:hypothetical protein